MSVNYCSVDGCDSKMGDGPSFFRCPKDEARCQRWKNALGFVANHRYANISPEQCYTRIKICSLHFEEESFRNETKKHLRYGAVPSLLRAAPKDVVPCSSSTNINPTSLHNNVSVQTDTEEKVIQKGVTFTKMGSPKDFYAGKNIFITGATGFLGVCLLEKILRTIPNHGEIYLLMRPKKGKEISERLEEIKKNSVFERLLKERTVDQIFEKVKPVAGDVGQPDLAISANDRAMLKQKINVIFHSAATLDFGDSLKTTVDINLLGTRRVTELAKECSNLKVFIHVSSAYVNSYRLEADEVLYPLPSDPEELISLVAKLSPEELEAKTPEILGDHPNPYTITKHMAEHEIKKCEALFPCTIVRPSMIVGSWKEPMPGWTVSKNGPQGFLMGASKGVIRRLPVAKELVYDYIPVDIVVNNLLVAGYHAGATNTKQLEIYHSTSSTRNPFKWASIEQSVNQYLHKFPLISAVWYPHLKFISSITYYKISAFFVHILPAIILDTVTRVSGGRPILMKLHRNVNSSLDRLSRFIFTEWMFSAKKTMELQEYLKNDDQDEFNVDISSLVWPVYFNDLTYGARVYLSKDPAKTLNSARKKDNILLFVHILFKAGIIALIWYLLSRISGLSMSRSWPLFIPAGYGFLWAL